MQISAKKIAELVEGALEGADILITGAQGMPEAGPRDVSFFANERYGDQTKTTKAGLLLVPETFTFSGRSIVRVKNPQEAFAKILWLIYREYLSSIQPGIHPTAIVAASAKVGEKVTLGPYCVIEEGVTIGNDSRLLAHCWVGTGSTLGDNCLIYPNVSIRDGVTIGDRVIIHSGSAVGSDGFGFVPGEKGHMKIPQIGGVEIADDVEIGANVAIDRATTGKTKIGRGTKIDNLVHISHNMHIGEHCFLAGQVGFAGSTTLGNFVSMGGQSAVAGHLTLGNHITIAGKAGVTTNLADNQTVSGFPARPHREELKIQALIHRLPALFEKLKKAKLL